MINNPSRIQDAPDANMSPGAGTDGYSVTWDDTSGKYVLTNVSGGATAWGSITGTLADQSDLNTALSGKSDTSHNHDSDYLQIANDLSDLNDAATARTNLGLGSAAESDTGDFATAAQGSLADSATQPNDLVTTLNVSATDKLLGRVSASGGVVEEIDCSDYSQTLLNLVDAAAGRTALGLGTAATQASSAFDAAGSASTVQGNLDTHEALTNNPHSVTRAQVGAPAKTHVLAVDPDANYDVADGVTDGDFALNTVSGAVFICSDNSSAAAVWTQINNGGGMELLDEQVITTTTDYSIPLGTTTVCIIACGGGGGGGGGRGTSGDSVTGGGGGAGGQVAFNSFDVGLVGDSISIAVGAGGTGGTGGYFGDGGDGGAGGTTTVDGSFGQLVSAGGGAGGGGGGSGGSGGGAGGSGSNSGGSGGAGGEYNNSPAAGGGSDAVGPGGGGGGGGSTWSSPSYDGGDGGDGGIDYDTSTGASGSTAGSGTTPTTPSTGTFFGGGGGGGGGAANGETAANGGAGIRGGGGGGAGSAANGTGGTGGAGGAGCVLVRCYG